MSKIVRVLHVYKIMNTGGAETFIMNAYRKIDKKKMQFDFLCFSKERGFYDDEIEKMGGRIFRIDEPSKRHIIKNIKDIIKVLREKGPYTTLVSPMMFYSGILCIAAKIAKVPNRIVHSHNASDSEVKTFRRVIYLSIMRILINMFSTKKVSCGIEAAKCLFKSTKNVEIINNGIDILKYQDIDGMDISKLKREFDIKPEEKIIGDIARFDKVKNHSFFIRLANYLRTNQINNMRIMLIGDGVLRDRIQNEINDQGLEKYFIFTGIRADIPGLLKLINVVVMPSFHEGFPVTIVEAIASGIPCVLSNNISKETNIVEGMIDYVSLDEDICVWYNHILRMLEKEIDVEYINRKIKKFDIEEISERLQEIYNG